MNLSDIQVMPISMRSTVALCLLFVFYTVNAFPSDDLEILRLQVRNTKWNIDDVKRRLRLLRNQVEEDTLLKVTEKWNEEQDNLRSYKTLLLDEIRNAVKAAELEGKDATLCYKDAAEGIATSEEVANKDAEKCDEAAQNSIQNNLGFIDNLIYTGDTLSMEADGIFLDCHDSDIFKMKTCIISELSTINGEVKTLERDTTSAEISAVPVSNNVVLQASNCFKKAYSIVYSQGVSIRLRATKCIEDSKEKNLKLIEKSTPKLIEKLNPEEP